MALNNFVFPLFIVLSLSTICRSQDESIYDIGYCVYTFYVGTGNRLYAATNSTIHILLQDETAFPVWIVNLKKWGGQMAPGHTYFQPGNIDVFTGQGGCIPGTVCAITVVSDGNMEPGDNWDYAMGPGWYCSFVDMTMTGLHRVPVKRRFTVEKWLAPSPYKLNATTGVCPPQAAEKQNSVNVSFSLHRVNVTGA